MIYRLDAVILKWLNSWVFWRPWTDALIVFRAVFLGWWVLAGLAAFGVLTLLRRWAHLRRRNWRMVAEAVAAAIVARFGVVELIRLFYDRPRPFDLPAEALAEAGVQLKQLIFHSPGHSFPSGHAAFYFAIAAVVSRYYPKTSLLFYAAALSLSANRIAAGLHWPSDVLVGAIIGVTVGLIIFQLLGHWRTGR